MNTSFDVFLSHNSKDKPTVRQLAEALKTHGLTVWLDEWELIPGRPWQEALEDIIQTTRSAAVLVGKDGLGPWEIPEMRACLDQFVRRKSPVIPVLLPGVSKQPALPLFLQAFTWVDLRGGLTESGLARLVWGITGRKPGGNVVESLPPAQQALRDMVCAPDRPADLNLLPDTLVEIQRQVPRTPDDYRLNRIAEWSQPRYALDKRFVQLTLLLDRGEEAQGPRWESSRQFQDLRDVLKETVETPALVLLGPPGSGKSTLLRRLEWDLAVDALRDTKPESAPLSFFVPLNQYQPTRPGEPLPPPAEWLADRWAKRFPQMPPLADWLGTGRGMLLLDALNEMPPAGREAVGRWKEFLLDMTRTCPGSRFLFSCRSLDYSSSLSSKDLTVPHVRIESLSDVQVEHFLQVYSPHGTTLWKHLKGTPQLDLYRTPIYLKMLVDQVGADGRIPQGRAALFTGFVRQALQRERHAENPHFQANELLTRHDCERLTQHRWKTVYDLPSRGVLFPKLASLAHRMQEQRIATEASQVRVDYERALTLLEHGRAEDILHAGVDLGVLDVDVDDVLYIHQLMQEYFAARCLAVAPNAERVRTDWRADRIHPNLEQVLE